MEAHAVNPALLAIAKDNLSSQYILDEATSTRDLSSKMDTNSIKTMGLKPQQKIKIDRNSRVDDFFSLENIAPKCLPKTRINHGDLDLEPFYLRGSFLNEGEDHRHFLPSTRSEDAEEDSSGVMDSEDTSVMDSENSSVSEELTTIDLLSTDRVTINEDKQWDFTSAAVSNERNVHLRRESQLDSDYDEKMERSCSDDIDLESVDLSDDDLSGDDEDESKEIESSEMSGSDEEEEERPSLRIYSTNDMNIDTDFSSIHTGKLPCFDAGGKMELSEHMESYDLMSGVNGGLFRRPSEEDMMSKGLHFENETIDLLPQTLDTTEETSDMELVDRDREEEGEEADEHFYETDDILTDETGGVFRRPSEADIASAIVNLGDSIQELSI